MLLQHNLLYFFHHMNLANKNDHSSMPKNFTMNYIISMPVLLSVTVLIISEFRISREEFRMGTCFSCRRENL